MPPRESGQEAGDTWKSKEKTWVHKWSVDLTVITRMRAWATLNGEAHGEENGNHHWGRTGRVGSGV
jgi:hypothetical protein